MAVGQKDTSSAFYGHLGPQLTGHDALAPSDQFISEIVGGAEAIGYSRRRVADFLEASNLGGNGKDSVSAKPVDFEQEDEEKDTNSLGRIVLDASQKSWIVVHAR